MTGSSLLFNAMVIGVIRTIVLLLPFLMIHMLLLGSWLLEGQQLRQRHRLSTQLWTLVGDKQL